MRFIANLILRFGVIEFALIAFVMTNALAFLLRRYYVPPTTKIQRMYKGFMILAIIAFGGIGGLLGMIFCKNRDNGKFRLLMIFGLVIALIPTIHIIHALTLDRSIRYAEIEFHSENWPSELGGYRIAFMTDFHTMPHEVMASVAEELNTRNLDLLLLGGDFSMFDGHYQGTLSAIAEIATTDGIFAVEGNHDTYWLIFPLMEQLGITPLDNSGVHIRPGFYLSGVRDLWHKTHCIESAIAEALPSDFVLLLSHNPDIAMPYSTSGIDLILSGHTHGGQITFFCFPVYLLRGSITDYGTLFGRGFAYSADGIPVFTSSGIGDYYIIPRIFSRPEVVIFTMYN